MLLLVVTGAAGAYPARSQRGITEARLSQAQPSAETVHPPTPDYETVRDLVLAALGLPAVLVVVSGSAAHHRLTRFTRLKGRSMSRVAAKTTSSSTPGREGLNRPVHAALILDDTVAEDSIGELASFQHPQSRRIPAVFHVYETRPRFEAERAAAIACLDELHRPGQTISDPAEARVQDSVPTWLAVVEQTSDSVIVANRSGVIEYVNTAFEQLTGYTRAEVVGLDAETAFANGLSVPDALNVFDKTQALGKGLRFVITAETKAGRAFQEERIVTILRDSSGEITHFVSTGRDITRKRSSEEALQRLHTQLELEAGRIAGVLHDEAGQFLTVAHMELADLARDVPAVRAQVLQVRRQLQAVEQQLRTISHELHPRLVHERGLAEAVRFVALGVARRAQIPISVDVAVHDGCPAMVETTLYRFVQEALTNMRKHSKATKASVLVTQEGASVSCSVRDNGNGFDPEVLNTSASACLGLRGIRDRVEAIGGSFEIVSAPGCGTELLARMRVADRVG